MKRVLLLILISLLGFTSFCQQPTQQWLNRYNGKGDYSDKYNCITSDNSGNIYLAGYTVRTGSRKDYLITKIGTSGDTLWTKTFNGLGVKDDEILAMTIDNSGAVYVTGYSRGNGTGDNIITQKYTSAGALSWSVSYNYLSNEHDQGNAIAVDASGNVYVAGQTDTDASSTENDDIVVLKYNSTGTQQWVKLINGSGNATDRGIKIVADNSGNSYITARSNNGSDDDILLLKYNSAGTAIWTQTIDNGSDDRPYAMTSDANYLYITGRSDNGSDDDYLTLKYDLNGNDQWNGGVVYNGTGSNHDRPEAIAVDATGNVYVTGKTDTDPTTSTNYDYCTIKYDNTGNEQWVKTYNGIGDGDDEVATISVNPQTGEVFVSGKSDINNSPSIVQLDIITIAYSTSGSITWSTNYTGVGGYDDNAVHSTLNGSGNVIICGATEDNLIQKDALAVQYNSSGVKVWEHIYKGQGDNSDNVNAMVVDPNGTYTYLAGYSFNPSTEKDMCVIKLNNVGDTLWVRTYNGTDNDNDEATDIKVDNSGNVYVTGFTKEDLSDFDITTIKYNASGIQQWVTQYNYASVNGEDKGSKISLDNSGNVIVFGYSDGNASATVTNEDFITIKYNNTGTQVWATRYDNPNTGSDLPIGLEALANGKVIVTGQSNNGNDDDITTICYNNGGTQNWLQTYDSGNGNDRPADMVVDAAGVATITGKNDNGNDNDIFTIQYSAAGAQNWTHTFDNVGNDDRGTALTNDHLGNIYIIGYSDDATQTDIITYALTSSGTLSWSDIYNGVDQLNDMPANIVYDGNGFVLIAGQTEVATNGGNSNFFIRKYNNSGTEVWSHTYEGGTNQNDGINCFSIDGWNNIYVSGNSISSNGQKDIVTIKYDSPLSISELQGKITSFNLFPNPFSQESQLIFENPTQMENTLTITDLLGKPVKSIKSKSDQYLIKKDRMAPGTYLFSIRYSDGKELTGSFIIQ